MTIDSDSVRFVKIIAVVLKVYVNFLRFYACACITGCIKKMKVRKMSSLGFSYVSLVETLLV